MAQLTIPDEVTSQTYTVTSAQSVFAFTFAVFVKTDLHFTVGGVELLQTDFTLTGTLLDGGGYQGGTITLNTPVSATTCLLWRSTVAARTMNYSPAPTVPVRDIDVAFNRITATLQDVKRDLATAGAVVGGVVTSVNTRTGAVVLTAADVAAMPVAGGTFTGTISGPTAGVADNTTKLATTAWVNVAISALGGGVVLSSTTPAALGVAAVGVGTTAARADHVHLLPTLATLGAASISLSNVTSADLRTAMLASGAILLASGVAEIALPSAARANKALTFDASGHPVFTTLAGGGDMLAANNLSDLISKPTARTNLGVAIGTNVQAWAARLDTLAAATTASGLASLLQTGVFPLTAKNDYQFGSLDPLGTGEPAKSWMNVGRTASGAGNENALCVQIVGSGAGSSLYQKAAILAQVVTSAGNTSGDFTAGTIAAGVGVYCSAFINGISSGYGAAWGAVAEVSVISGNDGAANGIEIGVYCATAAQENSDIDTIYKLKAGAWFGAARSGYRSTAMIMGAPNASTNGAWYYGAVLQDISTSFLLFRSPRTGAVAADIRSDTRWGDTIRAPEASRIARYNAANTATRNVISWTGTTLAIGETGDDIVLYFNTISAQKALVLGAVDSAGTGFRTVRVTN